MRSLLNPRTLAGQVFVLQVVIVLLLIAAAVMALLLQGGRDRGREARNRSVAVAQTFAQAPGVARALDDKVPSKVLQPRAEAVRKKAGVDYLVVFSTDGIRYTHPDPDFIGRHVVGSLDKALAAAKEGRAFTENLDAPQGPAMDTTAPVTRPDGSLAGLVSAGITIERVERTTDREMPVLLGTAMGTLLLAAAGTGLVWRRVRRQTQGLGPAEMTRMYEHHDAVLHAVREGVLIIEGEGRLLLANDEARRLLNLPADAEGRPLTELGLEEGVTELLVSGRAATDEVLLAGDRLLAVSVRATDSLERQPGRVATLRDTTELTALSGRARVARERLQLLYEAGVRIGTTLDVVRTAEELSEVTVPRFADLVTVDLLDEVERGEEPRHERAFRMRRTAVSGDREELPLYPVGESVTPSEPQERALDVGRAVLETDLQRWGSGEESSQRVRRAREHGIHSLVTVPLQARGVTLGMANFWRLGESPQFEDEDLSFAEEVAARAAVSVDNARRFTREHAMAVALQRSLLPRGLPEQNALEVAWRYLPAQEGVGGDWFDVILLPGARVALVVGDVVGHGLHAAATMGRLRTAVHNFSTLDLPADELLGYLDELVTRMDSEENGSEGGPERQNVTGATCLYAIYDSVTGICTVARAGHLSPAVAYPDGTVTFPQVPTSPPLGLGGHPFETTELRLPEGSYLVLYTDGLVEHRNRDIDTGLETLRGVLEETAGGSPENMCQALIDALLPARPADDIALLTARTRLLEPWKVADWEVPSDPSAVAQVRADCGARLRAWGLEEIGFNTELILSELITNAIRYGTPPIRLRLLYDRSLICEVSDASSTSPYMRRAAATDEGGRGLFLVAQLAHQWGTRYTPEGKVIWTEQSLHGETSGIPDEMSADALLDQFDDPLA